MQRNNYREESSERLTRSRFLVLFTLGCIFFIILPVLKSQADEEGTTGWDLAPVAADVDFRAIAALNTTSAVAVGENGIIFSTSNNGSSWSAESSGTTRDMLDIDYNGIIVACGDEGTVLASFEPGTWTDISLPTATQLSGITIAEYLSPANSTIFVAGNNGEIWKGNATGNWSQLTTSVTNDLYDIDFLDSINGIAVGVEGVILGTENGGNLWEPRIVPEGYTEVDFHAIEYVSPIRAFAAGSNGSFISSSGAGDTPVGYLWSGWQTGVSNTLNSVSASSIYKVWVAGDSGYIALSKKGGKDFVNQTYPGEISSDFHSVSMVTGFYGFVIGDDGVALHTDREGTDPATIPTARKFSGFRDYASYAYPELVEGLKNTLKIIYISILFGFTIGITLATFKTSQFNVNVPISLPDSEGAWRTFSFNPLKLFATFYTDIFRNTPLLVQFFFIHFGLVQIGIDLTFDGTFERAYGSAIVALGLNSGAYQTEIIRSGIQAIPTGQMEAGRSLGLTYLQTMRHVIMPQAIRIVIPPLGNETINLVLNSSLASAIGYGELTRQGKLLISITFETFWTWGLVLLFYFSITYTLTNILKYAERKLKIPGLGLGGET